MIPLISGSIAALGQPAGSSTVSRGATIPGNSDNVVARRPVHSVSGRPGAWLAAQSSPASRTGVMPTRAEPANPSPPPSPTYRQESG
jgi:hypothetical protein